MIDPTSPDLNFVVVMGVQSPGRAQITGLGRPYNWQHQEGYALSGAWSTYRGEAICKFTLTLALWLREHFAQWELFKKALTPPSISKPFFVEMRHPLIADAGIKAVGVEELGTPVRAPGGGLWLSTSKLFAYRPPKFALVKPDKTIPSPDKGKPIPPQTEADRALAKVTADVESALNQGRLRK